MRKFAPAFVLVAAGLLAGCWQSDGSLYGDAHPSQPFRSGKIEGINADKTHGRSILALEPNGGYRLTNDERGPDYGDVVLVRFFALSGAPKGTFAYEAQAVIVCRPTDNLCHPGPDPTRNYGLVRSLGGEFEMINPDCPKGSATAKLPGVKAGDYGSCTFTDRITLEKAMRALARTHWKADVFYRFTN